MDLHGDRILRFVRDKGYAVEWVLETHAHADHISAAPYLAKQLGAKIAIGEGIVEVQGRFVKVFNLPNEYQPRGAEFDHLLRDGEVLETAGLQIEVENMVSQEEFLALAVEGLMGEAEGPEAEPEPEAEDPTDKPDTSAEDKFTVGSLIEK